MTTNNNTNLPDPGGPKAMPAPANVGIVAGDCFEIFGRRIRIDKIHDNKVMELTDLVTFGNVQIKCEKTGNVIPATLDWLLQHMIRGEISPLDSARPHAEFELRDQYGDPDYLRATNPGSIYRRSVCRRITADEVSRTDEAIATWLTANHGMHPDDEGRPLPAGSTVKRWLREYDEMGDTPYTLVFDRGRKHGFSPLDPVLDGYVHAVAEGFYCSPRTTITSAHDQLSELVERYNATLPEGEPKLRCPSSETVRKRIKKLRNRERLEKKLGKKRAAQLCDGSGEPIRVTHPLEILLADCTHLDQIVTFDTHQELAACRVRLTMGMCLKTGAIVAHKVHPGPERAETTIEMVIDAATPPDVPDWLLERYPIAKWMFGKPRGILPDNAKSLVGPATIQSFLDARIIIHEPPIEMPQAKARLERAFGIIKAKIAHLPGTVTDPKRRTDTDRDAVKEACITLAVLEEVINEVIWTINCTRPADGSPSPAELWEEHVRGNALPVVTDIKRLRRELGKTMRVSLTYDGIVINSVRYRELRGVSRLIDAMAEKSMDDAKRKDGKLAFEVLVKLNPGDIDTIQVFDEDNEDWITLYSTQPEYTRGLTEWEHNTFKRLARQRNEAFNTEKERKATQYRLFASIEEKVPKLAFQRRRDIANLALLQEAKKRKSKKDKLVREITDDALAVIAPQTFKHETFEPHPFAGSDVNNTKNDDVESPKGDRITESDDELHSKGIDLLSGDCADDDDDDDAQWDAIEPTLDGDTHNGLQHQGDNDDDLDEDTDDEERSA